MDNQDRMHALDAVRATALLLGVVLHATESFLPGVERWAIADNSPSTSLAVTFYVIHMFRMSLFFVMAGFFAHLVYHRKGAKAFLQDRRKRILIPFLAGWPIIMIMIGIVWSWGMYKTHGGVWPTEAPAEGRGGGVPLAHLWFLYYLMWLYAITLSLRWAFLRFDSHGKIRAYIDQILSFAVANHWAPVLLAAPLCAFLYFTPWIMWLGIATPDFGLLPQLPALIGFGTAFIFGWLLHRQVKLLNVWEQWWPLYLVIACAFTAASLSIGGLTPSYTPTTMSTNKLIYAVCYTLGIWAWTFAFIGMALRLFSQPNAKWRYTADASYWIYLAHLPIVIALQVAIAYLNWHWSIKISIILGISFLLLFLSYHYWVRFTFIGERLNGRKYQSSIAGDNKKLTANVA